MKEEELVFWWSPVISVPRGFAGFAVVESLLEVCFWSFERSYWIGLEYASLQADHLGTSTHSSYDMHSSGNVSVESGLLSMLTSF